MGQYIQQLSMRKKKFLYSTNYREIVKTVSFKDSQSWQNQRDG